MVMARSLPTVKFAASHTCPNRDRNIPVPVDTVDNREQKLDRRRPARLSACRSGRHNNSEPAAPAARCLCRLRGGAMSLP